MRYKLEGRGRFAVADEPANCLTQGWGDVFEKWSYLMVV